MGRPRKKKEEALACEVRTRVTEGVYEELCQVAQERGLTVADVVREALFSRYRPPERKEDAA